MTPVEWVHAALVVMGVEKLLEHAAEAWKRHRQRRARKRVARTRDDYLPYVWSDQR